MSEYTPAQLAAEVDRLAPLITDGPWEVEKSHSTWNRVNPDELIPKHSRAIVVTLSTPREGADIVSTHDADAAALTPTLMAENRRLRREMEELRDSLEFRATTQQGNRELVAAMAGREAAKKITSILNGGHR